MHLFGKDGKGTCSFEDFSNFLHKLQKAVLLLEFHCHAVDDNDTISAEVCGRSPMWPTTTATAATTATTATVTATAVRVSGAPGRSLIPLQCRPWARGGRQDFARSMVAYADRAMLDHYAKRIAGMDNRFGTPSVRSAARPTDSSRRVLQPCFIVSGAGTGERPGRVSFREFAQFDNVIAQLDDVQYAVRLYSEGGGSRGEFTKVDLKRAIKGGWSAARTDAQQVSIPAVRSPPAW